MGERAEIQLDGITHGGEAVGRLPDGRVCFVPYALPGERVQVEVVEERRRWTRGRLLDVLVASPDRVDPPCPYFGQDRCGGCHLQHLAPAAQPALKRRILTEQLQRIGAIADPPVATAVHVRDFGYRNTARFGVDGQGRLGFRRANSNQLIPIDRCLLLDDQVQALREEAGDHWKGAQEVVVRAGLQTGERVLVVHPGEGGMSPLPPGDTPVAVTGRPGRSEALRGEPALSEVVAGRRFRISPTSFFQASTAGAEVLCGLVGQAVAVRQGETALDLYAGVGLFSAVLADQGARVTAVEGDRAAVRDARQNLAEDDVEVVHADAESYVRDLAARGQAADVIVLDPPRQGAGAAVCKAMSALGPRVVVYVSCDPAALARDARTLAGLGYTLSAAVPVDQFAQTAAIETVATFFPSDA